MLKNKSNLEVKTGDKFYIFQCDTDSPLGEVYDALAKMQSFVIEKMQDAQPRRDDHESEIKVE